MPIPIPAVIGGPPPPPPPPPPPNPIPIPPTATTRSIAPVIILTDSTGAELVIADEGDYVLGRGMQGFGLAPVSLFGSPLPDGDGSLLRGVRRSDRDLFIPVGMLQGGSYEGLRDQRRQLERIIDPRRGPVTITLAHPDGQRRSTSAWYTDGANGSQAADVFGVDWQVLGLSFTALDPLWYGDEVTVNFGSGVDTRDAFLGGSNAFLKMRFTQLTVIGATTVTNPGDADAYPVWTVTGPGTDFSAANGSTGKSLQVSTVIAPGDQVIVDTRRRLPDGTSGITVTDQDDNNLWSDLDIGSSLWPLIPGDQTVTLAMTSTTTASGVTMSYSPAYRSAM